MNVLSENFTIDNILDTSIHSHNMYWITKLLLISFEALQNNKIDSATLCWAHWIFEVTATVFLFGSRSKENTELEHYAAPVKQKMSY